MPDQYNLRQSRTFWDVKIPSEFTPQVPARGRAGGVHPAPVVVLGGVDCVGSALGLWLFAGCFFSSIRGFSACRQCSDQV